jgi:hypothetical protein
LGDAFRDLFASIDAIMRPMFRIGIVVLFYFFTVFCLDAQFTSAEAILVSPGSASPPEGLIIKPAPIDPTELAPKVKTAGVDWDGLFKQSSLFLGAQHAFRLATEQGTRSASSNLFKGYWGSVASLHGWADGDEFYVNYVGHPMEGAVAGFIWAQNDRRYRSAEFGKDSHYWKSRLRAGAFAWAYSEQFEIGPVSEASIGQIQSQFPQYGFVDHAVTPVIGTAWMIGEDAVDKYVIKKIENYIVNNYVRLLARSSLNPARSFANVMAGKVPWHRDTRSGIYAYGIRDLGSKELPAKSTLADVTPPPGVAPFEFTLGSIYQTFAGQSKGNSCVGGAGSGAVRIAENWQLVFEVGGCKFLNMEKNFSGDSISYLAGPRWSPSPDGRWNPHVQLLLGGNKFNQEQMLPERKLALELIADRKGLPPPIHEDYTVQDDSNGFAVAAGGGLDLKINGAIAIRVASIDYRRNWARSINGIDYSNGLQVSAGMVLRMGTW